MSTRPPHQIRTRPTLAIAALAIALLSACNPAVAAIMGTQAASAASASTVAQHLSDLTPSTTPVNGWGPYERDRSNGEQHSGDGNPLRIGTSTFAKGLGVHAPSDVRYVVPAGCTSFKATVGVDEEVGQNGAVTFEVWNGTTRRLHRSSTLTGASAPVGITVTVRPGSTLRLVVATGASEWHDHADWADARLICATSTTSGVSSPSPTTTVPPTTTTTAPPTTTTTAPPTTTTTTPPPVSPPMAPGSITSGNRVGFAVSYLPLWQPTADLTRDLDAVADTGAKWMRVDFPWSNVQAGGPTSWDWSATDRAVSAARARGLQVLATLAYTPGWARPGLPSDKYPPTNNADYAAFVRAAVARYSPLGVKSWEIWNEPNVASFWMPSPNAAAYTRLLQAGYAAVKSVDPSATVVSAGVAHAGGTLDSADPGGYWISPYRFVNQMYAAGAKGSFDALGLHPYAAFPYAPSDASKTWNTFQQSDDIHALMTSKGDGARQIWATEIGYHTGDHPDALTESQQATYTVQYLDLWDDWSFTGPLFLYMPRDRSADLRAPEENFGVLLRADFTRKGAYAAVANAIG